MNKPNCYKCRHRRDLDGSAHSRCAHPKVGDPSTLESMLAILASTGRINPITHQEAGNLGVRGNTYGVINGWFNWPYNFDPMWLEACDGFEKHDHKEEDEK